MYVINFFGDEVKFIFPNSGEEHIIPGRATMPDGGILELFLSPGNYEWLAEIGYTGLKGAGRFDVTAGQIQGIGLSQGKVGPEDVIEGFDIGADPLAPPVTPTPTPVPTPPTPSPGRAVLAVDTGGVAGELIIEGQKHITDGQSVLFVEVSAGDQDVVYIYDLKALWPNNKIDESLNIPDMQEWVFKVNAPADHICTLFTRDDTGINVDQAGYNCQPVR